MYRLFTVLTISADFDELLLKPMTIGNDPDISFDNVSIDFPSLNMVAEL